MLTDVVTEMRSALAVDANAPTTATTAMSEAMMRRKEVVMGGSLVGRRRCVCRVRDTANAHFVTQRSARDAVGHARERVEFELPVLQRHRRRRALAGAEEPERDPVELARDGEGQAAGQAQA